MIDPAIAVEQRLAHRQSRVCAKGSYVVAWPMIACRPHVMMTMILGKGRNSKGCGYDGHSAESFDVHEIPPSQDKGSETELNTKPRQVELKEILDKGSLT
jgi:hypothetical protein